MVVLSIDVIRYILSFNEKEYYWNRCTKSLHIRFIAGYMHDELSYLFTDTYSESTDNCYLIQVCRRNLRMIIAIFKSSEESFLITYDTTEIKEHMQYLLYLNEDPLLYLELNADNDIMWRKPASLDYD